MLFSLLHAYSVLQPPSRLRLSVAFVCALTALGLYASCLSTTVTFTGDCGELIAASYRGGVAHPSGYPLFCVLGRAFAFLPFGEIAWRYNLFSAFCGAATVGVVAAIVTRLTVTHTSQHASSQHASAFLPAIVASLLLAGFSFFGAQAVITEVYSLNGLLIAASFYCAVAWKQNSRYFWLWMLALLLGLSFNSHLSALFVWPGVLLFLAPREIRTQLNRQRLVLLFIAFVIGFSFTLYLPLRARTFPEPKKEIIAGREYSWYEPLDWGHPVDFARWKTHVTVGQYDGLLLKPRTASIGGRAFQVKWFAHTPSEAMRQFVQWCGYVALQFLWSTPLLIIGLIAAFAKSQESRDSRHTRLGAMLLLSFVLNVGVAVHYDVDNVFDIAHFLFPTYIVLAIWLGLGADWLFRRMQQKPRILALCHVALLGAIVCQWYLFAGSQSFRGNTSARDLALERAAAADKLLVQTGKAPTLLLLNDDTLFPFWYVQKVLGHAPQAQTPWGLPVREFARLGRLPELVTRFQQQGPVAIAQWDEGIDQRFPYTPLNESGSLWLASRRRLPVPAIPAGLSSTPGVTSHFAREQIRRREVTGFIVHFKCPHFVAQKPLAEDVRNKTKHIGWIEVLLAPHGYSGERPVPSTRDNPPTIKQVRRLIVSEDSRIDQRLQTMIPLQIPIEARPGEYQVWTRVVRSVHDISTQWQPAESVQVVVK